MLTSPDNLRESLSPEEFTALLKALNLTAIVSSTNEKGDIVYANDKFVEISKYSQEELVGQNHRILKSGDQPQEMFDDLWKTISSGKVWRGEIKNRAKDGAFYWVDSSIAPISGNDGKPKGYISIRFLITGKKEAEEQLQHHLKEMMAMNKLMIDRELKMAELKEKIRQLELDAR